MQLLIRRSALGGNVQEFWCKIPLVKEGFARPAQFAIICNPKSAPTPRYTSNLGGGNARPNGNVNFRPRYKPWSSRYELFPAPDGSICQRAKQSPNGQTVQNQRILYPGVGCDDGKEHSERKSLNAILVLAGGQLTGGGVPEWVRRRLDKALELQIESGPHCKIVCLGGGTPYRRPILTPEGFVIHESNSCAEYLLKQGAQVSLILKEWSSFDTIGNGFFALTQHVIPRGWTRMAVVTSDFHMPRSQEIFEWVFGLQGTGNSIGKQNNIEGQLVSPLSSRSQGFLLQYHGVSDQGIDKSIIQARVCKEQRALESLRAVKKGINTLEDFHEWFHTQHMCYNVQHQNAFGKHSSNDPDDPARLSY